MPNTKTPLKNSRLAERSLTHPASVSIGRTSAGRRVWIVREPSRLSDQILGREIIVDKLALRDATIRLDHDNTLGLTMEFVESRWGKKAVKLPNGATVHFTKLHRAPDDDDHPDLLGVQVRMEFNPSRIVFPNRLDGNVYVDQLPPAMDALTQILSSAGVTVDFQDPRVRVQRIDFARDFLLGDTPPEMVIRDQFEHISRPRAPRAQIYREQKPDVPVEGFGLHSTAYLAKLYDLKRRHGPDVVPDLRFELAMKGKYGRYWDFRQLDQVTLQQAGHVIQHQFDRLRFGAAMGCGYLDLRAGVLDRIPMQSRRSPVVDHGATHRP